MAKIHRAATAIVAARLPGARSSSARNVVQAGHRDRSIQASPCFRATRRTLPLAGRILPLG